MALIRLTNLCNAKCVFCNFPDDCAALSLEQAKAEIDKLAASNDSLLCLSGGEPTIYPWILEIIDYAKQKGFKEIEMQTNCLLLANSDLSKQFKTNGLTGIFVTIHSDQPEIFEKITGVPGSSEKTKQGIGNLLDLGINVRINVVINFLNYQSLVNITKFIIKSFPGIKSIDFSFIVPTANVMKQPDLVPLISDVIPHLIAAYQYCQEQKIVFSNPGCGIPLCFIPQYKDNSLEYKILKSAKESKVINDNRTEKIKFPKCQKCEFDQYCLGFWPNYIKIHGDKEFI